MILLGLGMKNYENYVIIKNKFWILLVFHILFPVQVGNVGIPINV